MKSAMQLGTLKYSGRAIIAGFCFVAVFMAVWAAAMFSCSVERIFKWITATFNAAASVL